MASSECYPDKAPRVNRLLKTLSSPRRREVIHYFEAHAEADTDSLVAVVSHVDKRTPETNPAEVEVALHHMHLPKLEESGWIDYEPDERRIHYHGKDHPGPLLSELAAVFSE